MMGWEPRVEPVPLKAWDEEYGGEPAADDEDGGGGGFVGAAGGWECITWTWEWGWGREWCGWE